MVTGRLASPRRRSAVTTRSQRCDLNNSLFLPSFAVYPFSFSFIICRFGVTFGQLLAQTCTGCSHAKATASIEHVTFGDVWYCSGQSNMALPLVHSSLLRRTSAIQILQFNLFTGPFMTYVFPGVGTRAMRPVTLSWVVNTPTFAFRDWQVRP